MRLFAILSWYDESPTWLQSCVSSLSRLGVDHVIAVDGSYLHFDGDACSGFEQSESVAAAANSLGMGLTLVRPNIKLWTERDKRNHCFKLLNTIATPMQDWVIVIDADELVVDADMHSVRSLLCNLTDEHVAIANITQNLDPFAQVEPNKPNLTDQTHNIYRKIDVDTRIASRQSRFFRVLNNMRVTQTHYNYYGTDDNGVDWNLRPDIGTNVEPNASIASVYSDWADAPTIEHRDPWRALYRLNKKHEYYALRDELGIER